MPGPDHQRFTNQGIFSEASIQDFLAEAEEQLTGIEEQLLALEEDRESRAAISEMFRHLHGLKGNTGLLLSEAQDPLPETHPLLYLQKGSHEIESAVDQYRKAETFHVSDEEIAFLFQSLDFLQRQIRAFQEGRLEPVTDSIFLGKLGLLSAEFGTAEPAQETRAEVFKNVGRQGIAASRMFLEQLPAGDLPAVRNFRRSVETLIKAARYSAENVVLSLALQQIALIEEALGSPSPMANLPLEALRELQHQIEAHVSSSPQNAPRLAGLAEEEPSQSSRDSRQGLIRVDPRKIDDLMRLVGQMVVLRNQFSDFVARADQEGTAGALGGELRELNEHFSRASEQLQHNVMALRLFPLRTLLQRLQRLVRDLSVSLGKEIRLVTEGEEIQLDKTLIDNLGEPLVHLLRNSADHGIESADVRVRNGKPATGTISVRAYNEGSSVVIAVSDDGKGLNTAAIRTRAVSAGLASSTDITQMTDAQVHKFIFHPGFSTTESVTSLSGRGVGLDLVLNTIRALRGSLAVESSTNAGTTFHIRLPASVLVSRGILVESSQEEYIIPVESIRDLVRVDTYDVRRYRDTRLAVIGGLALPILFLSELLGNASAQDPPDSLQVAVLDHGTTPFGLVVDRFQGEIQAVIQPLRAPFAGFEICVGAAILGSGRVVLVLDPAELSKHAFPTDRAPVSLKNHSAAPAATT